ncbi:MAG TPA: biotin/lipoyl-binding protein, partial [Chitinispirillaceae bacterium]|nr:biotin/lipoyl-binding protein [Chitinispirillaceae bacterium]
MSKRTNLLLSTITIFLMLCNKEQNQQELQKHVVGKTGLRDVISQTGEVRSLITVELKSEASGRIDTIYVKEGQAVTKGD